MRAVIDTNVLLSGLLWHGAPHGLLEHVRAGTLGFISSPHLIAELTRTISLPKFARILERSAASPARMTARLHQLAELHDPIPLPRPICRDPDDDAVLSLALHAHADCIVSGDQDLLTLHPFAGIPILSPAQAIARISG